MFAMDQFAAADHLIGVAVDTSLFEGLVLGCVVGTLSDCHNAGHCCCCLKLRSVEV
jgi:hypothetical protein